MLIDAKELGYKEINEKIRESGKECEIVGALGQRFIAAGMSGNTISIDGVPGNALGAYLNGASIKVKANAQDAVGDTMNDGLIVVGGNIGDAAGYAMRGGKIFVKGDAGYRAGIHMKAYKEKIPVMIIGGRAGSFLGEYQAGGVIVVLGLKSESAHDNSGKIVGYFPCTGMHGGKMFLRSDCKDVKFPGNVNVEHGHGNDFAELKTYIEEYCDKFGLDAGEILNSEFTVVTPDTKNPYKQMYVAN